MEQSPGNIMVPQPSDSPRRKPAGSTQFEKPSIATSNDAYSRFGRQSLEASMSLTHTERRGTAASGSWNLRDIDWKFCFRAQHYGTAFFAILIIIALGVVHWCARPRERPFFLYDASISYISGGDTVPAAAAVLVPFALLIISLVSFEFGIYRLENWHITNAVATCMHFLLDCVCAFATVECFTESTKMAAGRLRPDFFQQCNPDVDWTSGAVTLGVQTNTHCEVGKYSSDGRKSFCSGHSSTSAVITAYNICYLIWAGKRITAFCPAAHLLLGLRPTLYKDACYNFTSELHVLLSALSFSFAQLYPAIWQICHNQCLIALCILPYALL